MHTSFDPSPRQTHRKEYGNVDISFNEILADSDGCCFLWRLVLDRRQGNGTLLYYSPNSFSDHGLLRSPRKDTGKEAIEHARWQAHEVRNSQTAPDTLLKEDTHPGPLQDACGPLLVRQQVALQFVLI